MQKEKSRPSQLPSLQGCVPSKVAVERIHGRVSVEEGAEGSRHGRTNPNLHCGSAVSQEETPLMAQSSPQMALAYAAAVPTFLGPGHPGWRHRGEDAAVTWVYPLTQGMMQAAQVCINGSKYNSISQQGRLRDRSLRNCLSG